MLPDNLREFDDVESTRKWLYENTTNALQKSFPHEDDEWRLELDQVEVQDKRYDLEKQKQALIGRRRLPVPVKGRWRLTHKPTKKVTEHAGTLMNLPYITERGTALYNGNEYSTVSQSRLKPGVYTRIRRSGQPEAFFNVKARTGRTFRIYMEPDSGRYKFDVGGSAIPAFAALKAAGATDKEMIDALGSELVAENYKALKPQAYANTYNKLAGKNAQKGLTPEQQMAEIKNILDASELSTDVTTRTLGLKDDRINKHVLLRAMQKMRNVNSGDEEPDDRDAPKYSNVLSVEDLIPERIEKDAGGLRRQLFWAAKKKGDLSKLQHGALNPYVDDWLLSSRLTMPLEETNPLSLLEQMTRVTKLGEGGIGSAESITDEARNVNPGQTGFVDLVAGPEGLAIGIDTRAAFRTFKGRDRQMHAEFRNPATGKTTYHKPEDLDGMTIAFPGEMKRKGDMAKALRDGKLVEVPKDEVSLEIPSFGHMSHAFANLNPMPTAYQPARAFYGAKFWGQYMPQAKGEVPLVDSLMPDGENTFSEHYGRRLGSMKSPADGEVVSVAKNKMVIQDQFGEKHTVPLVQNFPFNRLTGISYSPMVEKGMKVAKNQPIAHSNFTDKNTGSLVLGQNLRTAVLAHRGDSYEDAQVISESAARKLATERLYGVEIDKKSKATLNKNAYASIFQNKFTKDQLANLDDNGVVQPGTVLKHGDPIILATGPKLLSAEDAYLGRLSRTLKNAKTDKSETWDHHYEGVVTDAKSANNEANVFIKASVPAKVGDKLSPREGLKGTIGKIIPDDEMPRDPVTGLPYEFLLNPMGVQSRIAPNTLMELQLGRIARATGKQVRLPQEPPEEGWQQWVDNKMKEAGLESKVQIFDPKLGRNLDSPVSAGELYVMAFHHLSDKKQSTRGSAGLSYTHEDQPAKGSGDTRAAKRISGMDLNALMAHGAPHVINDALLIRGSRNDEYFRALRNGLTLPKPKQPMIYNKMLDTMRASGIQIRQDKDLLELMPMTDKDIEQMSNGAIAKSAAVDRNFEPVPGGLFDPGLTQGGLVGTKWTHVDLPEPMPNPIFEEPIRRLLGLTQKQLRSIVTAEKEVDGMRGGEALRKRLADMDIDAEIKKHRDTVQTGRGQRRDNSIKALGYLDTLRRQGNNPADWVVTKFPVLPPQFRPVSRMGDVLLEADMNSLYRDLIETGDAVRSLRGEISDDDMVSDRGAVYDALNAVAGMGEAITPEGRAKNLKGALRQVIGNSPKTGIFQSRVLSKNVDLVGRGVVSPDPNLDMDTIGIPEESAWVAYKDFTLRRLRRQNIPMERALNMWTERDPAARKAMLTEMNDRPVIVDRAPTWHKFNFMAFKPIPIPGSVIRTPPLINKSFTLDHDGDQMNFHVPVDDKAAKEAWEKMRPSANLISLTDLRSPRYTPQQEFALGLYRMTQDPDKRKKPRAFLTREDAEEAYQRGEIKMNDPIVIGNVA